MSDAIAPLPNGMGISVVAEHGPRPERDARQHGDNQSRDSQEQPPTHETGRPHPATDPVPAPLLDDPGLPAGTLFTTALIANELDLAPPNSDELKLRAAHGWVPPDSPLHLKDKLI